jgi:ribose transport system substrate-binding protein
MRAVTPPSQPSVVTLSAMSTSILRNAVCISLVVSAALLGGCSPRDGQPPRSVNAGAPKEIRLAYITNGIASFWNVAAAGVKAGEQEFGVRCEVLMPPAGIADQKRMLEDCLARELDGVALSPIDATNQTQLINEACRHTILITQDCDAADTDRLCYLGMDNYDAGQLAGKLIKEALPDGGSVIIFVGRLEQVNARQRRQGIIDELLDRARDPTRYDKPNETLVGAKYTVLDTRTDQFDFAKAKALAEDAIAKYPDLGCMVGLFAYNPTQCLAAIKEAGKLGKIQVVGFDEEAATLQGIADGEIYGTVVQNPYEYGRRSVEILSALVRGDKTVIPASKIIHIPAKQIRRDNVQEFWADLKVKMQAAEAPAAGKG